MRGAQKAVPGRGAAAVRMGRTSGAVASTISSPASTQPKFDSQPKLDPRFPMCTGCGMVVSSEVKALQCDKCVGKWTCIECIGISEEVYDGSMDCKDICWFCTGWDEVLADKTEDRVLAVLERVVGKLNGIEDRLQQKADVRLVEVLEQKLESKITHVEERLDEMMEHVNRNSVKLQVADVNKEAVRGAKHG